MKDHWCSCGCSVRWTYLSVKSVDFNRIHLVVTCFDSLHIPNKFQGNCLHSGIFPPHRMDGVARHMMSWSLFAAGHDVAWRLQPSWLETMLLWGYFPSAWLVVKWAISEFHEIKKSRGLSVYLGCWLVWVHLFVLARAWSTSSVYAWTNWICRTNQAGARDFQMSLRWNTESWARSSVQAAFLTTFCDSICSLWKSSRFPPALRRKSNFCRQRGGILWWQLGSRGKTFDIKHHWCIALWVSKNKHKYDHCQVMDSTLNLEVWSSTTMIFVSLILVFRSILSLSVFLVYFDVHNNSSSTFLMISSAQLQSCSGVVRWSNGEANFYWLQPG